MGMPGPFSKSCLGACSCEDLPDPAPGFIRAPNAPDLENFTVVNRLPVGRYTVVKVHYPGCVNYGGQKILLFRDLPDQLTALDPHFCENKLCLSPVARFVPTAEGLRLALLLAGLLARDLDAD